MLAAQHRVFGRGIRGITDPLLYTYTHLGDGSTQTDNLFYDPSLKLDEVSADNKRSGVPDDRWAFTARMPAVNYGTIGALAAASRALRGYNDAFADECLALAKKDYADERTVQETATLSEQEARFLPMAELTAVSQLLIATQGEAVRRPASTSCCGRCSTGCRRAAHPGGRARRCRTMDAAYKAKLQPYVGKYRASIDELEKQNPYGVPISTGGWAGSTGVTTWAIDQLPPAQGVSGPVRAGATSTRGAAVPPRPASRQQRVVRLGRRGAVEDDGLRQHARRLLVHPGRRRARRAGPQARLPGAHGGLAVPLGRERGRDRRRRNYLFLAQAVQDVLK